MTIIALVAICISQDMGEIYPKDLSLLLVNGVFILPVSFALFTIGPSLISAPEVSLYTLIETVLGPVLVWTYCIDNYVSSFCEYDNC